MLSAYALNERLIEGNEPPIDIIMDIAGHVFALDKKKSIIFRFSKVSEVDPEVLWRPFGYHTSHLFVRDVEQVSERLRGSILWLSRQEGLRQDLFEKLAHNVVFDGGHERYKAIRAKQKLKVRSNLLEVIDNCDNQKSIVSAIQAKGVDHESLFELGVCKPFGVLLERYIAGSGYDFSEFLRAVREDWGLTRGDFAEKIGVKLGCLERWLRKNPKIHNKPSQKSLDKISAKLNLSPKHQDLLRAIAAGEQSSGLVLKTFVSGLQDEMREVPESLRVIFASAVLKQFIRRSGMSPEILSKKANCSQGSIYIQANMKSAFNDDAIPMRHRLAQVFVPDELDKDIQRSVALLFVGIPEYRSPETMLGLVRSGNLSVAEMVREYRLQQGFSRSGFGEDLGGFDRQIIRSIERRDVAPFRSKVHDVLVERMGFDDKERALFLKRAAGISGIKKEEILKLIDRAVTGEKNLSDIVNYALEAEYAPVGGRNDGIADFSRDLGVSPETVRTWRDNKFYLGCEDLAGKFADLAQVPDLKRRTFIDFVTNSIPSYDHEVLARYGEDTLKSRKALFKSLLSMLKISQAEFSKRIGLHNATVKKTVAAGFWKIQKVSIQTVAEMLIPPEYPEDQKKFIKIWGTPISKQGFDVENIPKPLSQDHHPVLA